MEINNNLSEINAEMLLNHLFPELCEKWTARYEGTFFRNYNDDALTVEETEAKVSLARDGFLNLLPQGFITQEDDLRHGDFKESYQTIQKRKHILEETFLPFDTFAFHRRLQIERVVSQLLESKLEFILKEYFHFDLAAETDVYVKNIAVMLPYVSKYRGNFNFVRDIISCTTGCDVEMQMSQYSHTDTSRCFLPCVHYQLIMNNIDSNNYQSVTNSLDVLKRFITEWFMPYEVKCDMEIKNHDEKFVLDDNMILNYNTEL